jgi:hypothetical protein
VIGVTSDFRTLYIIHRNVPDDLSQARTKSLQKIPKIVGWIALGEPSYRRVGRPLARRWLATIERLFFGLMATVEAGGNSC